MNGRIYIAGHTGLVGSAVARAIWRHGYEPPIVRRRSELDLRQQDAVERFFRTVRPEIVILAAATVGGIVANATRPAEFIYDNLMVAANVIHAAGRTGCRKLVVLGSSCIYPRDTRQPIRESALLTGPLEPTNRPYAIAKIAALEMARAYHAQYGLASISLMPTNLYGPGDRYDLVSSHVLPALLRRFHEAKTSGAPSVTLWGTGTPRREFLHVDDLAEAVILCLDRYDEPEPLNVGTGTDVTIAELAILVARVVGYTGEIGFDAAKPDGTPRKLLDVSRIRALGWEAKIGLEEGMASTYTDVSRSW